ncbi:MAG: hypothetical protein SF097_02480 [Acidobacteriota bacterium]|nr:hypothetical protein [Acidobacteriota bacterium]
MFLPRVTRKSSLLAMLLLFLGCVEITSGSAQSKSSAPALPEDLHGGIEIGSKGVKAIALRIFGEGDDYSVKVLYAEIVNTTPVQTKDGKFTTEAIRDTANAVQRLRQRMLQDYKVPAENMHIVVSSGLIGDNPQDLSAEIVKRTGLTPDILDVDTEVQLTIAGAVPKRYKSGQNWLDNRGISVLIDIGSGNTKGGYQQLRQIAVGNAGYDFVTWGIPKGTVTFTNEVGKTAGETADYLTFTRRAQALSNDLLRAPLRNEIARKPGLLNRRKVYLSGGIVWAMATLLRPEDRRSFTPLTMDDINNFYLRAVANPETLLEPDLSRITNAALRQEAEREVESVRNTFTPKNLIAGAEILRAVATEMNFANKRLQFVRFGHLAWILSYVRLQAER